MSLTTPSYEQHLNTDLRWALSEGSRHFEEDSAVFKTLHTITSRLNGLNIPYAVIGGMALFRHGLRRFTEDIDILVTRDSLRLIHEKLDGRGYLPPFANSKHLRDTEHGVRIEFLTTGDFPGDGKKKPVAFPDPQSVAVETEGVRYISLEGLIELKLASGMTNPGRLKDLSDVLELIKVRDLTAEYSEQLNPYVRAKYLELWHQARKRFVLRWPSQFSTDEAKSAAAERLREMIEAGVLLEDRSTEDEQIHYLVTTNESLAQKFGLVDESEYWFDEQN